MTAAAWIVLSLSSTPATAQIVRVWPSGWPSPRVASVDPSTTSPSVGLAYDSTNHIFLLVYGAGNINGAFLSETYDRGGAIQFLIHDSNHAFNETSVGFGAGARAVYSPDLNNGTGGFLVVWGQYDRGADGSVARVIHGAVAAYPSGVIPSSDRAISDAAPPDATVGPAIAYDAVRHRFLVAWTVSGRHAMRARILDLAGAPAGSIQTLEDLRQDALFGQPDVAWNPVSGEFGLTYQTWSGGLGRATFRRLSSDGVPIDRREYTLTGAVLSSALGVNAQTGRYVVALTDDDVVAAAALDSSGRPLGGGPVPGMVTDRPLQLAFDAVTSTFLLVANPMVINGQREIMGIELTGAGAPIGTPIPVTCCASWVSSGATVLASRQNTWMIGYVRDTQVGVRTGDFAVDNTISMTFLSGAPDLPLGSLYPIGCAGPAPAADWACTDAGWSPPATNGSSGSSSSGGTSGIACPGIAPATGWSCAGGAWWPPTFTGGSTSSGSSSSSGGSNSSGSSSGSGSSSSGSGSSSGGGSVGCPGIAPGIGWVCAGGAWFPPAPAGSGSSSSGSSGGSSSSGSNSSSSGGSSSGSSSSGGSSSCPGIAPGIGWVCASGAWFPPVLGGSSSSSGGPSSSSSSGSSGSSSSGSSGGGSSGGGSSSSSGSAPPCPGLAPGVGWVCAGGAWFPPSMTGSSSSSGDTASSSSGGSSSSGSSSGGGATCPGVLPGAGWTCSGGAWFPPFSAGPASSSAGGAEIGSGSTPANDIVQGDCVGPDPFAGIDGVAGVCVQGAWVPTALVTSTGTVVELGPGDAIVWTIAGDDGQVYVPTSPMDPAFQADGLRVDFQGKLRLDAAEPIVGAPFIELTRLTAR